MNNKHIPIIIFISFAVGMFLNLSLILLGAYLYAKRHSANEDFSFAIKKGELYINNAMYSNSIYDIPYNHLLLPIFGVLMILLIIWLIRIFGGNLIKTLALNDFNKSDFAKTLVVFSFMSIIFFVLSKYYTEFTTPHNIQLPNSQINAFLMILGAGFFIPIYEEFVFRGLIYKYYYEKGSLFNAIIFSSFLFSILHFHYGIAIILTIFVFSILLGGSDLKCMLRFYEGAELVSDKNISF